MCADKPPKTDKPNRPKGPPKNAKYAEGLSETQLSHIAESLRRKKGGGKTPGRPAAAPQSFSDQKTVFHPGAGDGQGRSRLPAEKLKAADGDRQISHADGGTLYRPGISDNPQHRPGEPAPQIPAADRYKDKSPSERRFFMLLDKIAEESRVWYAKYGAKRGSEYTRLRGASEGLDGLSPKARANMEAGNHPRDAAFPLEGRVYFNDPAGGNPKWIDRKDIPYGTTHVANGRLDSLSVQGAPGESDFWVRRTANSIEVQPCYPEDPETIAGLVTQARGQGLTDSMGNAVQADPDTVRSIRQANHKLNGWIGESLMRGETIAEAKDFAWKKATDEFLISSTKVISMVLSISANGISMSFGAGAGFSGGSGGRFRLGRMKGAGRTRTPQVGERLPAQEPSAAAPRTPAAERIAGTAAPAGEGPAAGTARPRSVFAEGRMGEIRSEPEVSYTQRGKLGKPEGSASPVKENRSVRRAEPVDRGAARRAEVAGEFREAQESLPGAERTEQGTYRSANTRRTLNEQETPTPKEIQKAQVKTSYDLGLEGAKAAARDGVQIQHWEPSTKFQGEYGVNIDDIGRMGGDTVILEWKGEGSKLAPGQSGSRWAGRKIAQLEILKEPMADRLLEAARSGKLKGMVYNTRAGPGGEPVTTRLGEAQLRGAKGTRMKNETISQDGVISYSPREVEAAYRAEKARLERAIRDGDRDGLKVLFR